MPKLKLEFQNIISQYNFESAIWKYDFFEMNVIEINRTDWSKGYCFRIVQELQRYFHLIMIQPINYSPRTMHYNIPVTGIFGSKFLEYPTQVFEEWT